MVSDDVLRAFDNLCYEDKSLVWVATSRDAEPHLVPVCFVKALSNDQILIGNVFISRTVSNVLKSDMIAVGVAFKGEGGWNGYMLKGRAEVLNKGRVFEGFKKEVLDRSGGKRVLKSAVLVRVESAFSLAPGFDDKRLD